MANDESPEEFDELINDPDLTEEKFANKLNEYVDAYRAEFEEQQKSAPENVEAYTRDFFRKNLNYAAAEVVHLAQTAVSESVRLAACRTIIKEALLDSRAAGDPVMEIINDLKTKAT